MRHHTDPSQATSSSPCSNTIIERHNHLAGIVATLFPRLPNINDTLGTQSLEVFSLANPHFVHAHVQLHATMILLRKIEGKMFGSTGQGDDVILAQTVSASQIMETIMGEGGVLWLTHAPVTLMVRIINLTKQHDYFYSSRKSTRFADRHRAIDRGLFSLLFRSP